MPSFAERVIAAHQAGVAEKQKAEDLAQRTEDRKLQQDILKHQVSRLKILDAMEARQAQMEQAKMVQGLPAPEVTAGTPGGTFTPETRPPEGGGMSLMPSPIPASFTKELSLPPTNIQGVPEMGLPETTIPTVSKQQQQRDTLTQHLQALRLDRLKPFNIGPDEVRVEPSLAGGPSTVLQNPRAVAPKTPTEGEVGRGLSAAYFRDKHQVPEGQPLTQRQQAEADAEYEAYKKSLSKDTTAGDLRQLIADQMEEARKFTREGSLRDDYRQRTATTLLPKVDAYKTIQSVRPELEANDSKDLGGSDILLIYNFIKMNDPNAVREGELRLAQETQTVPDAWKVYLKRLTGISGEVLGPTARKSILTATDRVYDRMLNPEVSTLNKEFSDIATRSKINPDNINMIHLPALTKTVDGTLYYKVPGGWSTTKPQ